MPSWPGRVMDATVGFVDARSHKTGALLSCVSVIKRSPSESNAANDMFVGCPPSGMGVAVGDFPLVTETFELESIVAYPLLDLWFRL